jgi:phosphoglycerate kinase
MSREVYNKSTLLGTPARPFVVVLGGAKVADKIGLVRHLVDRIDALLIGGAMAYTFLRAQGVEVGDSLVAEDEIGLAREVLDLAAERGLALLLPSDHVVVRDIALGAPSQITAPGVPTAWKGVDIGPATTRRFADKIVHAKTIFWNGPLGVFEIKPFDHGTVAIATEIGRSGAFSVVGGGDSVAALVQSGHAEEISHISTGGGAALEFLEGRTLPGLAALES